MGIFGGALMGGVAGAGYGWLGNPGTDTSAIAKGAVVGALGGGIAGYGLSKALPYAAKGGRLAANRASMARRGHFKGDFINKAGKSDIISNKALRQEYAAANVKSSFVKKQRSNKVRNSAKDPARSHTRQNIKAKRDRFNKNSAAANHLRRIKAGAFPKPTPGGVRIPKPTNMNPNIPRPAGAPPCSVSTAESKPASSFFSGEGSQLAYQNMGMQGASRPYSGFEFPGKITQTTNGFFG